MPTPTVFHVATRITSASVPSVNATGEALFGRPFIVTERFGWAVETPATVLTATSSATVHASTFVGEHPKG